MDKRTLNAMLVGIGKGLQSYDPNNMFSGLGAALSTTSGAIEEEDTYERRRKQAREDRADEMGIARADRATERAEARSDRASEFEAMRGERASAREEARQERKEVREEQRSVLQDEFERLSKLGLGGVADAGRMEAEQKVGKQFTEDFARLFGKNAKRFELPSFQSRMPSSF